MNQLPQQDRPADDRSFVLFKTDLFLWEQPEEDIGKWFPGGDCAGWFYARLLPMTDIGPMCDPTMEDWGWTFGVAADEVEVWVDLWHYFEIPNCWLLGVRPRKRVFRRISPQRLANAQSRVCDALDRIIAAEKRIEKHEWFSASPFDSQVTDF